MQSLVAFRQARASTLELVGDISEAGLAFSPGRGRWSIGEVLDHLIKVDEIYRGEFEELIERAESGRPPLLERGFKEIDISVGHFPKALLPLVEWPLSLASRFMPRALGDFMIRSRFIYIENPAKTTPVAGRLRAELLAELASSAERFGALFAAHPDVEFRALIHRHPLFGINNVPQMLEILTGHERRHQAQIRDIHEVLPLSDR